MILKPVVGGVEADTPAALSGLAEGDEIAAIDGTAIGSWEEMAAAISKSEGRPLVLTVKRGESLQDITITPIIKPAQNIFGETIDRYVIGISAAGDFETQRLNPLQAFLESVQRTYYFTKLTVVSVVKLILGTVSTKTLGGPIMIAEMAGQQAKEGAGNLVTFIALLSINLAILNILPIPVLDGGHLLFFAIEAVTGRPVNVKVREVAQQAGIFLLMLLMILVFYNDITRIFFR
jgi:regulator of sigma E protease